MAGDNKKGKIASFTEFKKVLEGSKSNSLYEGFEYNKLAKDVNGFSLNFEHLKNYGSKNKYTISVLRKIKEKTFLYNYVVKNDDLPKFFKCYFDDKIEGEIIEIEKMNPENLA